MTAATDGRRVLYVVDPMCSWCWGFAPVIAAIARDCAGRVPIRPVVGGLRAGETRPMDAAAKDYVRHHWQQVAERTGQPFDHAFFAREGFVYDTEPACRAVVAVRSIASTLTLPYLARVQRAFYADNADPTETATLGHCAAEVGVDEVVFRAVFPSDEAVAATRADFRLAAALEIPGFPAVILQDSRRLAALTVGWQSYEELRPALGAWLDG